MIIQFLWNLFAYGIGAIPTGFIIARVFGIDDIRSHGSGNIGATNVARVLGKRFFFIVLMIDACKAFAFIQTTRLFFEGNEQLLFSSACFLLIGNCYSAFLAGDGGKGVSTLFGIICSFSTMLALFFMICWGTLCALTKVPALASLIAAGLTTIASLFILPHFMPFLWGATTILIIRHRKNLSQLFSKK